jgi:hypothetical protein
VDRHAPLGIVIRDIELACGPWAPGDRFHVRLRERQ